MKKQTFRYILVLILLAVQGCQISLGYKTHFDVKESASPLPPILIKPEDISMPDIKWDNLYIHQAPVTGNSDNPYSEYVSSVMQGTIPGKKVISVLITHEIYRYSDTVDSLKYISNLKAKTLIAMLHNRKPGDVELTFENKEIMASCQSDNKGEVCVIVWEYPRLVSITILGFSDHQDDVVIKNALSKLAEKVDKDIKNLIH